MKLFYSYIQGTWMEDLLSIQYGPDPCDPLAPVFAPKKQVFPNEVQMKIWEACTPGDRVIHIYPQRDLLRVVPGREDSIVEALSATRTLRP
jgi:hypothetical protein